MEPAVGGHRLAAEAEDKIAEVVLAERQSDVDEEDVLAGLSVGMLDGLPDGEDVRMYDGVGLAEESGVPQVGLLLAVDNRRTADDTIVVAGDEQSAKPSLL